MRTCPRFIAASIVLAVTLAWSSLAGALSLTFVLPGPSGGEDARAAAIEAEVRAIANGGYPVTAETVAMGSTRLSGDLVIALGPAASAWLRGQSITGIKILAGTLVADQPPGVDSGLSVAVGWSVADGIQLLTGLSLPTVVAVGQGKAPVGLRIPWLSPETARTRHWDGGAAGVVLAPDGFDGRTALVAKLRSSGVAVYDLRGGDRIDPNAVGGPAAAISTDRLARWIALIARDVAAGQKRKGSVEDVRSTTAGDAVRPDVLQSLELDLPWQVASRSRWLPPAPMPGGLSLDGATRKALETNYGLRSARASIEAAEADITAARANLMPSVDLGMSGAWIDQDRAASGGGANPELTLTGDASLTQLIYSHDVYTQLRSTKAAAEATRQSVASVRLDTVRGAALAWLRAQRAHANLDVRARLLDSTRTNQGLANARKRAGQSGDADIVRWESQVATDTAGLMSALLELTRARLALNAALGQGGAAGAPVSTVDFEQVLDTVGARGIMAASSGGRKRRAVESLLIRTAQRLDPDLAQLDAQIRAQHLVATGTRVGLWVPTVSVSAQLSQQLANGG
ncbi:MAG: outer membrane protein TolC, partial [Myxococcota bacterium]